MVTGEKPKPPFAGIVYGEIIYWGVWVGSLIVMIGSILAFLTEANYINPSYCISSIWQGMTSDKIWEGAIGSLPQNFWYLSHLKTGDGLVAFGLSLGVFSVIPALIGAAIVLIKQKEIFFAWLAVIAALIVFVSMAGLISVPS
ncbi:hypothetical protein ACFLZM_03750 [Thermodesulfobacteriota bacterium]